MHLVAFDNAPRYDSPGHDGMQMRRLQGREAGPGNAAWIGLSILAPGGGTTLTASDVEKFYVVLAGELEITGAKDGLVHTATLRPLDSCRMAPGEARQLRNRSTEEARVLLVMAEPR